MANLLFKANVKSVNTVEYKNIILFICESVGIFAHYLRIHYTLFQRSFSRCSEVQCVRYFWSHD